MRYQQYKTTDINKHGLLDNETINRNPFDAWPSFPRPPYPNVKADISQRTLRSKTKNLRPKRVKLAIWRHRCSFPDFPLKIVTPVMQIRTAFRFAFFGEVPPPHRRGLDIDESTRQRLPLRSRRLESRPECCRWWAASQVYPTGKIRNRSSHCDLKPPKVPQTFSPHIDFRLERECTCTNETQTTSHDITYMTE